MFGFLLKLIFIVLIVAGIAVGYQRIFKSGQGVGFSDLLSGVNQMDFSSLAGNASSALDSLITHTDRSPMVMGIDITNKSLEAMVDTLRSLPPEEMDMVRQLICQPATPSSQ